jgi:hypothetical protein
MNKLNRSEIKNLIISSMNPETDAIDVSAKIEEAGVSFDFKESFSDKVLDRLFTAGVVVTREIDFVRSLNLAFYRIALTGVAAIVVLLISIFLMEGSLSFNSFLGLSNSYDESIVCLLTGN